MTPEDQEEASEAMRDRLADLERHRGPWREGYDAAWRRLHDVQGDLAAWREPLRWMDSLPRPLSGADLERWVDVFCPGRMFADEQEWEAFTRGLGCGSVDVIDRLLPEGITLAAFEALPEPERLERSLRHLDARDGPPL